MQPRILLSSFALILGVSGVAYAGGDHSTSAKASQSASATPASQVTREQTMAMQRALTARNLYQGPADGVWGPKTESALRNFQTQSGLEATGQLNDPTARALGIDQSGRAHAATPPVDMERQPVAGTDRVAPAPGTATPHSQAQLEDTATNVQLQSLSQEQAREMQQRLQLLGYYRGEVDGKVGEGTRAALQRYFQRQAELARQGVISAAAISQFGTEVSDVQPVSGQDKR